MTGVSAHENVEPTGQAKVEQATSLKYCDIVMKGGITSGVVYPGAVCELAKHYQFKSIGGASSGAIAAAATAAAELGRSKGLGSFKELEDLPRWLGEDVNGRSAAAEHGGSAPAKAKMSNLFALFQPQPDTRPLFNTLVAFLGDEQGKAWRVVGAALSNFWGAALLGAVPGLLLLISVLALSTNGLLTSWAVVCALLMIVVGAGLAVAFTFVRRATAAVPNNGYGLCTGYQAGGTRRHVELTAWLSALFNRLAGLPENGAPLTFGDLWGSDDPGAERRINLTMIATNLSHGRPYRLPFDTDIFFFDPQELASYFPGEVVNWMVKNQRQSTVDRYPEWNGRKLVPLPTAADLPVVVATRMSLSFPILLSAVPLYAIDYTPTRTCGQPAGASGDSGQEQAATGPLKVGKCWFSDGGIAINFPIHFFDQPLPQWPTFGLNLSSFPPGTAPCKNEAENIWMPNDNGGGMQPTWTYFENTATYGKLPAFLSVILNTARSWSDDAQMKVPGYRDRIVHIKLDPREGGLNLNMDADTICRLNTRGMHAGALLAERFADPDTAATLSWDNHRWVRFRSTMALLEEMLGKISDRLGDAQPGERTYLELIERSKGVPPTGYEWHSDAQQKFAELTTDELIQLVKHWRSRQQTYGDGAPKPQPELRIQPRI